MPEPAVNPVAAPAENRNDSDELGQLRQLLVGPEIEQLARVQMRLSDTAGRAADLAQILPEAIRGAKPKPLRDALEPAFERAFSNSVRKNPKELADAISPIIGPGIRNSIAAAIRDFAEALNQIVEKSVSFRAIRWRIESLISGKSFTEILLARSLLYSVQQVFLIHRKSGLLLLDASAEGSVLKDADMISGMLTAIQDFVSDSFVEGGRDLDNVEAGGFRIWLTHSPKVLLAAAVSGTAPVELRQVFRRALDRIEDALQSEIDHFKQDDVSVFEPARPFLEACLLGQSTPRGRAKAWPWFALFAVLILGLAAWRIENQWRWNRFFEVLKRQPGFVVTGVERNGFQWVVTGLKDPQAPDPSGLMRADRLDPGKVRYVWEPYLSLNTSFAAKRDLDAAVDRIRKQIIRFDSDSSRLVIAEADRIDDLVLEMGRLLRLRPNAKISLMGHADEVGNPERNDELSLDRANSVADALAAQGVPRASIEAIGMGNRKPLRAGTTDWDRATNRAVSFEVTP